jgi:acetyl esterase
MPLLAVVDGTSVSLALIAHDKGSPNIVYQQPLWPAVSAELDTESYRSYGEGPLPAPGLHAYGWDHNAPIRRRARTGTQPRCRPPRNSCSACRRPSSGLPRRRVSRRGRALRAQARRGRGADATNVRYNGTIHDFALLNALLDVPQHWHGNTARRHRARLPPPLTSWLGWPLTRRRTPGPRPNRSE